METTNNEKEIEKLQRAVKILAFHVERLQQLVPSHYKVTETVNNILDTQVDDR